MNTNIPQIQNKPLTEQKPSLYKRLNAFLGGNQYAYLFYAFLIPVVLMYLIYLAMGLHPFGDGSVLILDLNGQYVSFYEMLRGAIYGDTSLIYSFERALGGEFMGIYAYYLASPFSYIVALFPAERTLEALLTIFLLKSGLCGFTMGWYLHKNTRPESRSQIAIVVFSILYAMTSYCVVQQHNSMWIDAVIWLPILTYAIEQLIKNGRFKLFVLILALTLCSNYYIGYMVCIYVAAYFFYYYFANDQKRGESVHALNNPYGEKAHFRKSFIRIAFYSLLAIGIAAIIVFTAYYSLKFGKSSFSNPSWAVTAKFEFIAFLTKFLPGSYDTVRPEGLPFVYCGVLTLILVPIYFLSKRFTQREKVASGIFVLFFVLSFVISILDLIWHGFQRPNWLNYRYSFMLCFFLLVLAYKAFNEIRKESFKTLFAISASLVAFVFVAQTMTFESYVESESKLLTFETIFLSLLCILAYLVILAVARKTRQKESICLILAIVCCLEVFCSGLANDVKFGDDVIYTSYSRYNDYMNELRPITAAVQDSDKGFYRMEKTTSRKTNDSMALDMNSLSCSTSTLNKETIDFLRYMGYASKSNWSKYAGGTPVNDSLLGVKYLISDKPLTELYKEYPVNLDEENKHTAYLNPFALSLAFGVDDAIRDIDLSTSDAYYQNYDSPMGLMNALITKMLGEEETVEVFKSINQGEPTSLSNCEVSTVSNYTKFAPITPDSDSSAVFEIMVPYDQGAEVEVFFFIPADQYTREVKLKVGNTTISGGFGGNETNRIVSLGTHAAGSKLRVTVTINNTSDNLYIKQGSDIFYYIDNDTFKDAFTRLLEKPQYVIDENYRNDHLTGTITTADAAQTILTTIPYDEGWTVLVDGERVEYEKSLNSMISFVIDGTGEHSLEFVYRPKALVLGSIISIASLTVFALLCVFEKQFRALIWQKKGKTIGVSTDDTVDDPSLWGFSYYFYDPPIEEEAENNTTRAAKGSNPPSAETSEMPEEATVDTDTEEVTESAADTDASEASEDASEATDAPQNAEDPDEISE